MKFAPANELKLNALIGLSALQRDLITRIQTENIAVSGYNRLNKSGPAAFEITGVCQ